MAWADNPNNLATLQLAPQCRLALPFRPDLAVRDAAASRPSEVHSAAGPQAGYRRRADKAAYPACGWPGACPAMGASAGIRIHISR
jgi:hypothetical protein